MKQTKKVKHHYFSKIFWIIIVIMIIAMPMLGKASNEKYFQEYSLNENFVDDCVIIVLTNRASLEFKEYTPDNFKGVNCIEVIELTSYTKELAYKQYKHDHTLDGKEKRKLGEELYAKYNKVNVLNLKEYRCMYNLKLDKHSKENVLSAIKILMQRDDIYVAEPNYIYELD